MLCILQFLLPFILQISSFSSSSWIRDHMRINRHQLLELNGWLHCQIHSSLMFCACWGNRQFMILCFAGWSSLRGFYAEFSAIWLAKWFIVKANKVWKTTQFSMHRLILLFSSCLFACSSQAIYSSCCIRAFAVQLLWVWFILLKLVELLTVPSLRLFRKAILNTQAYCLVTSSIDRLNEWIFLWITLAASRFDIRLWEFGAWKWTRTQESRNVSHRIAVTFAHVSVAQLAEESCQSVRSGFLVCSFSFPDRFVLQPVAQSSE